jgi:hypothetical protein
MIRIASLAVVLIALSGPALAVSAAVRAACAPDAQRLCAPVIHDEAKRRACMRAHSAELSKDCLAALRKG